MFVDFMGMSGERPVKVVSATSDRIAVGSWGGQGTNQDGSTYSVCFNVASDRTKLTSAGSTCEGGASLVFQLGGLTDSKGGSCAVNVLTSADVEILFEQAFSWSESPQGVYTVVLGEFSGAEAAAGDAERNNFGAICQGDWSASASN